MSASELLTIPEAAAQIGVSERTLYRLLKSDTFAARTVTEHRQTVTGRRLTTLLPPDLVEEIARIQPPPSSPSPAQERAEGAEEGGRGENSVNASKDADNDAANGDKNTSANADNTSGMVSNGDADTVPPEDGAQAGTLLAVVIYHQVVVRPQMTALRQQVTSLTQTAERHTAVLDKHAAALDNLAGAARRNADATQSLAGTVDQNAAVTNENAATANYNTSLRSTY